MIHETCKPMITFKLNTKKDKNQNCDGAMERGQAIKMYLFG